MKEKINNIAFIIFSILVYIFLSEIIGIILLGIMFVLWLISLRLGSMGSTKNKVNMLKIVETGYRDWEDEEIKKQIKAIEECGYEWFHERHSVGFKHIKTGLYLKVEGLHLYTPEDIKMFYKKVWSKDSLAEAKIRDDYLKKIEKIL